MGGGDSCWMSVGSLCLSCLGRGVLSRSHVTDLIEGLVVFVQLRSSIPLTFDSNHATRKLSVVVVTMTTEPRSFVLVFKSNQTITTGGRLLACQGGPRPSLYPCWLSTSGGSLLISEDC